MKDTAFRWLGRSLTVITVALASACADGVTATPVAATSRTQGAPVVADVTGGNRLPDLTSCPKLAAPEGSTLVLHAFGIGVQIYQWNGTIWAGPVPSATLYANVGGTGEVASHFAGPTWQSNSGGKVVGTVAERCTPDAASIPWLSLTAIADGAGVFQDVSFIQRLNTVGGNPPSAAGSVVGQQARVPYTADYFFYKAP